MTKQKKLMAARKNAEDKRRKLLEEFKLNYDKDEFLRDLAKFQLQGNVIDQGWFSYLINDKGLVQMNAVIILSEIVYWYRPSFVYDEETGNIKALKPKFRGDMLQKSYDQLADKFGLSKGQVESACKFLEEKELILLDFRTIIQANGKKSSNVLYIGLYLDKLKEISVLMNSEIKVLDIDESIIKETDESVDNSNCNEGIGKNPDTLSGKIPTPYQEKSRHPIRKNPDTNTKTTSTKTISTKTIKQSSKNQIDRLSKTDIEKANLQIKKAGFKSYKDLIKDIALVKKNFVGDHLEYVEVVKKAIWQMYYYDFTTINKIDIARYDIVKELQKLDYDIIYSSIETVIEYSKTKEIKHQVGFMKAILFNEIAECSAKIQSQLLKDFTDDINYTVLEDNFDDVDSKKTRFHNLENRSDNYTDDELDAIVRDIEKEKRRKYKKINGKE